MPFASESIPRHLLSPGQEGYRTPTIEDYEHFERISYEYHHHSRLLSSAIRNAHSSAQNRAHTTLSEKLEKLSFKQRIRHFTWTYFTLTMATGGIANMIHQVPLHFAALQTIGTVVFIFNMVLFLIITSLISTRFYLFPSTFRNSFYHPTESLFVPAAVVSLGFIFINITQYGLGNTGPWLNSVVTFLFWLNATNAVVTSSGIYLLMWSTQTFTIAQMTPVWIFPAYPLLILGPHAGALVASLDPSRALPIVVGGFTLQGIGFLVALTIYSAFIYRLMTQKLPPASIRPAMFVSVGPAAFTAAAMVNIAANAGRALPATFMGDGPLAGMIIRVVADWAALWLWGLAIWFFIVSVGAHISCFGHGGPEFAMTWFSFVFPNTALATSTFAIGNAFDSIVIKIIGCVFCCLLIVVYLLVVGMMIRAIIKKQILWPQKGEDKCEGGFKCCNGDCPNCVQEAKEKEAVGAAV